MPHSRRSMASLQAPPDSQRHNCPNISGKIGLTAALVSARNEARPRDPRAPEDPRHGTRSGHPPAQRRHRRRQRPSSPSAASAARPPHRRTTRDPHPTSGEQPRTRTRGHTKDGTDASHRQFAAQPPDQAQLTAKAKGGSEATVKIAKADLVPTAHNLRDEYADLAGARDGVPGVHGRGQHASASRDAPAAGELLAAGARASAPAAAAAAHAVLRADPQGRLAGDGVVGDAIYSVPHELIGERVWVRADGEQLVVVHIDPDQGRGRSRAMS